MAANLHANRGKLLLKQSCAKTLTKRQKFNLLQKRGYYMRQVYCNENYTVDRNGTVYNKKRNRKLSSYVGCDGYVHTLLYKNGIKQRLRLHDIVFWSYNTKVNGMVIDHIDSDKTNNALSNLRMVTNSENVKKAYDTEERLSRCNAEITVRCVETGVVTHFHSIRACSRHFGFNRHNVSKIVQGRKINSYPDYEFSLK